MSKGNKNNRYNLRDCNSCYTCKFASLLTRINPRLYCKKQSRIIWRNSICDLFSKQLKVKNYITKSQMKELNPNLV